MNRLLSAIAIVCAIAAAAQAQEEASFPEVRLKDLRPAGVFNQHLYFGAFSRPRALAIDREHKELWVADTGNGMMSAHRLDGMELYSFSSATLLRDTARVSIAPRGRIVVIEGDRTKARVFNYRGQPLGDLPLPGMDPKPILGALAWAPDGVLYAADNRTSQIYIYDSEGHLKIAFGSHGTDEGQFQSVCGIAVGPDGNVYVADNLALAIQIFDRQGNFIRGWGRHEMGGEHVSLPSGIAVDSKLNVYLTDELRHQVKVFTNDGKLLFNIGGLGDAIGFFSFPTDIAIDGDDRVYVTERATSRVQIFEPVYGAD